MEKLEIVKKYFGYNSIKKEQALIIDNVISGFDTIGVLPTGFGKSLTFVVSAMMLDGITIVISPLISLMQDQVNNLLKKGIKAAFISSIQEDDEINIIYEKLRNDKIKILYVSGERLLNKYFRKQISKKKISLLVFDEAHTLIWSEDFRESLGRISEFISFIGYRPYILALSATLTKNTLDKISNIIGLNNPKIVKLECDRENIFYDIIKTKNKKNELLKIIHNNNEKIIIYCLTIRNVIDVYEFLKVMGYKVTMYHGSLDSVSKKINQNEFCSGKKNIIVATNSFGMGIDVADIRYVIEYDMPQSIEDFSQQTGRASRDGAYAYAILFFDKRDIETITYFIENITNDSLKEEVRIKNDRYKKLDSMVSLALTHKCIHKTILNYFGYDSPCCNNMCVNCKR